MLLAEQAAQPLAETVALAPHPPAGLPSEALELLAHLAQPRLHVAAELLHPGGAALASHGAAHGLADGLDLAPEPDEEVVHRHDAHGAPVLEDRHAAHAL